MIIYTNKQHAMDNTISVISAMGDDLRTRSFFRRDVENLIRNHTANMVLDFNGVQFVSRSVADEICNILEQYQDLTIKGMAGNVKTMYDLVVKGRRNPRVYPEVNARMVQLNSMEEVNEFFSQF